LAGSSIPIAAANTAHLYVI